VSLIRIPTQILILWHFGNRSQWTESDQQQSGILSPPLGFCHRCPLAGANCPGGSTVEAQDGWYKFREELGAQRRTASESSNMIVFRVYQCPLEACSTNNTCKVWSFWLKHKIHRNTHDRKHRYLRGFPVAVKEEITVDVAFYAGGAWRATVWLLPGWQGLGAGKSMKCFFLLVLKRLNVDTFWLGCSSCAGRVHRVQRQCVGFPDFYCGVRFLCAYCAFFDWMEVCLSRQSCASCLWRCSATDDRCRPLRCLELSSSKRQKR